MNQTSNQKLFNRDYFDRQDPADGAGSIILPFCFSSVYDEVDKDNQLKNICDELYNQVYQKLKQGQLGENIDVQLIDYLDAKQKGIEKPRRYLQIVRETNRNTRITILARFLPYGNKLYVGVDCYVLGNTNWVKIFILALISLLPFTCYPIVMIPSILSDLIRNVGFLRDFYQSNTIGTAFLNLIRYTYCCIVPWILFTLTFIWLNTFRNFRQEKNSLNLSLRQSFNRILNSKSFNIDDILMTLKSILPLILNSIKEVFTKYNLSITSIEEFSSSIQTINNIQNIYGYGNAVSGAGGKAKITNRK